MYLVVSIDITEDVLQVRHSRVQLIQDKEN